MHIESIRSFDSLRKALVSGRLTVLDAVESALARLEAAEHLHAVRHTRHNEVRREAERADRIIGQEGERAWQNEPLLGIPLTVKELTAVAGLPHSRGGDGPAEVAQRDAPAVRRLRNAGALVLGTTSSPAGGWCAAGLNGTRPATVNPWNTRLTAGGSSGGAAAAVATGVGLAAVGTDGAGSVRIPASFCGVVGYKPTFGLIPYVPPSSEGLSHLGALANNVEDATALVDVMSGADPDDPSSMGMPSFSAPDRWGTGEPLRVAWAPSLGAASPEPAVLEVCRAALRWLADAGHHLEQVDPPSDDGYHALATILAAAEARTADPRDDNRLHPLHRDVVRWGRSLSAVDLATAIENRSQLTVAYDQLLDSFDVLVTPTVPVLPFDAESPAPAEFLARSSTSWLEWTPNTYTFNLSGQPAVTVPVGRTATGLPIGLQIAAARHQDPKALRLASEVHRAAPGLLSPFPRQTSEVGAGFGH
ncbi:amidase [Streptomyces sp. NPDC059340]|uniref:amidase n=1 Tax=Streptomyces sp. NPDC059340 TaxID=3346806 RepID=UPI0036A1A3F9